MGRRTARVKLGQRGLGSAVFLPSFCQTCAVLCNRETQPHVAQHTELRAVDATCYARNRTPNTRVRVQPWRSMASKGRSWSVRMRLMCVLVGGGGCCLSAAAFDATRRRIFAPFFQKNQSTLQLINRCSVLLCHTCVGSLSDTCVLVELVSV